MSVLETDLKFLHTLQNDMGGAPDVTNAVNQDIPKNNIFSQVTVRESKAGLIDYRCIFVANNSATDILKNALLYLEVPPANPDVRIELGIGRAAVDSDEPEIDKYTTPPQGVFFQRADDIDTAVELGDIPSLAVRSVWLKRIVDPSAATSGANQFILALVGETE